MQLLGNKRGDHLSEDNSANYHRQDKPYANRAPGTVLLRPHRKFFAHSPYGRNTREEKAYDLKYPK